mmetsp:Transcript_100566/g.281806  ORF Transcript_100566/g.281806 Transcript_100566/m.281806 type:complete len:210 (-) Transcript_100566:451-1080(-)
MAMASDKAACSSMRSVTRWSYSAFFSLHIVASFSRKARAASIWAIRFSSCIFFWLRMLSLSPSMPCLVEYSSDIVWYEASIVSMSFSWAASCLASVAVASSKFALKVSRISLRMPTTSPACEVYAPVKGAWRKASTFESCFLETKAEAAIKASFTVVFKLAKFAPLKSAMYCLWSAAVANVWSAPMSASTWMACSIWGIAPSRSAFKSR